MRYHVLAADYDGTLAHHGRVDDATYAALVELRRSGRKLVLVTGRELEDLHRAFPQYAVFDAVVAENGAVLHLPADDEIRVLAEPPPPAFAQTLQARLDHRVSVGRVIVATWQPHEATALEVIEEQGLELQLIFNKGAVMILPSGVNKGVGLAAALEALGLSRHNAVGVGDAENDHALLSACECAVAVGNALEAVKARADLVTTNVAGAGVAELVGRLLAGDLADLEPRLTRHHVALGRRPDGSELKLPPYGSPVLFAGPSQAGKSTAATALIERLHEHGYQCCVLDPEGDFREVPGAVILGDADSAPPLWEAMELLERPGQNVVLNLLGVPLPDRPAFFEAFLPRMFELRGRTGRPHWLVVDEAHHLAPPARDPQRLTLPPAPHNLLFITVNPAHVSRTLLAAVQTVFAFGSAVDETLAEVSGALGAAPPPHAPEPSAPGEAQVWFRSTDLPPQRLRYYTPRAERRRHIRKYATGELGPDRSFYFRGPQGRLNLRAHNLDLFLQIASGLDDETWLFHLRNGDFSRWFREAIKDPDLAGETTEIERRATDSAAESRAQVERAIRSRYTAAA